MSHMSRRQPAPRSDFGPVIVDPDTGEWRYAIPIEVSDVAEGTRGTVKRARRADPLNRVDGVTKGMRDAAERYRRAFEHVQAGIGMGPMDAGAERVQEHRPGDGLGVRLMSQERAYTASVWHTRGAQAIGLAAAGVVHWVVIEGLSLSGYDAARKWREGGGKALLLPALARLAKEYECE